jgi:small ligand-binding sensory domain FIST
MGSELCITVTGSLPPATLHEGMRFAAARYTKVASQFSTLRVAVSFAAQSIIGHLSIDVPQAGVVGEIVARFREYANQCSCLKAAGLGVHY